MTQVTFKQTSECPDFILRASKDENEYGLIIGTYELEKTNDLADSVRHGSLALYSYDNFELSEHYRLSTNAGVLSICNVPTTTSSDLYSVALSTGSIGLFDISYREKHIKEIDRIRFENINDIFLCVSANTDFIWYSSSSGKVGCLSMTENSLKEVIEYKTAHSFEAWFVMVDKSVPNICYSSSDDCSVKVWDNRSSNIVGKLSKVHEYGVCHLSYPDPSSSVICCSSFDGSLSFWDTKNTKDPLSIIKIGVTAWNIKWHETLVKTASISAIGDGCHVISFDTNYTEKLALSSYTGALSLVYSSEWCKNHSSDSPLRIICTSFYDRSIHIWEA